MKVEVDLKEIEDLRETIRIREGEIVTLQKELHNLDSSVLMRRAQELSYRLLNTYITSIFKGLGFESGLSENVVSFDQNIKWNHQEDWWKKENLNVHVVATVSQNFRRAFLSIGVECKPVPAIPYDKNPEHHSLECESKENCKAPNCLCLPKEV